MRGCRHHRGFTLTEILAVMAILSMIIVSLFTIFRQGTETWRLSSARTEAYIKARQILEMMAREIRGALVIPAPCGPQVAKEPSRADLRGLNGENPGDPRAPSNSVTLQRWRDSRGGTAIEQHYSDQIYFVTPRSEFFQQDLCMIGYWVQDMQGDTKAPLPGDDVPRGSKDDVLMRYSVYEGGVTPQKPLRWFDFTEPQSASSQYNHEVALSVRALDVKYYDYDKDGHFRRYNAWDSRPANIAGPSDQKGTTSFNRRDDENRLPVAVRIKIIVGDQNDVIKPIKLSKIVYLDNARRNLTSLSK